MTDKERILAKIQSLLNDTNYDPFTDEVFGRSQVLKELKSYIDSLQEEPEMVDFDDLLLDPRTQYASIDAAIKAHAKDYSFNIESGLFHLLNPEQQKMWRKEIEQAVISGGYCGLNLATDNRYNQEEPVSEDLEKELSAYVNSKEYINSTWSSGLLLIARHFANWQKQQMMKDTIPANILTNQYGNKYIQSWSGLKQYDKYKNGDEVKLIIIKKE